MPSSGVEPSPSLPIYIPGRMRICSFQSRVRIFSSVYWVMIYGVGVQIYGRKIRYVPITPYPHASTSFLILELQLSNQGELLKIPAAGFSLLQIWRLQDEFTFPYGIAEIKIK